MVMNFNNSYMGGMNYGGNNMYSTNNSPQNSNVSFSGMPQENVHYQYKMRYGTEDCFKKSPYVQEYPKPYIPLPKNAAKISTWQKIIKNFFC